MTTTAPLHPSDPHRSELSAEDRMTAIADHLVHHLTAASLLLRGLQQHMTERTLAQTDLNANLELLLRETDASRELALAAYAHTRASH